MKRALPFVLLALALTAFVGQTRWQSISEAPLVQSDGQGYYAYLPAAFIYNDLAFNFVDSISETYYPGGKKAEYVFETPTGKVNKYFVGTAIMQAPFFLAGHVYAVFNNAKADGYSVPYQKAIGFSAIFYLCLGCWFLLGFLQGSGFNRTASYLATLFGVFATNLLYYSLFEPSMSHVYSFCTVAGFLYFSQLAMAGKKAGYLAAALAFGLTALIRPTNGVVLLTLPMVAGGTFNFLTAMENLFKDRKTLFGSLLLVVLIVSIQPLVYLVQTGSPVVWSYNQEGFNFLSPEIFNVLFSYRKGLFVFSPILFVSLFGIAAGLKRRREEFTWLLVFLGATTWVISSWWMWFYGGSFGHRAFIEYIPFFAVGLAYLLQYGWGLIRPVLVVILCLLLTGISLIQTYQYETNILPFDGLTKERYWNLFLRTGEDLAWYYPSYQGANTYVGIDSTLIVHNMEQEKGWGNEQQLTNDKWYGGNRSSKMSSTDQYGVTLRITAKEIVSGTNVVRVSAWVWSDNGSTNLSFVCSREDSLGTGSYWKKHPLRPQFRGQDKWSKVSALFPCGPAHNESDKFVVYPLKSDDATVFIDDLEVSFIYAR